MSSAWVRRRDHAPSRRNPRGSKTYLVCYRRGGRAYRIETAGSFQTEREAKQRKDLVLGWLAGGLDPRVELARMAAAPPPIVTVKQGVQAFLATRIDVGKSYRDVLVHSTTHLTKALGTRYPHSVTVADLQAAIAALPLAPSTTRVYVGHWKSVFDFLEVDPNPAKDKRLRLPQIVREEVNPPTWEQLLAALERTSKRHHLPLVVLEQTGMRVGEIESLTWGDVDEAGCKFRLRTASTKTKRARWVQVPEWLMPHIAATCAVEDRGTDARVFPRFTAKAAWNALNTACAAAGVPHFSPHDLRHRRATIWHHSGLPVRVQMERGGWTRSEIPLEVYSHLMPLDEAPVARLEAVLT